MDKTKLFNSLLSELSVSEITNALYVLQSLSKNDLLKPKYINILLRLANELNVASPDFVESVTVVTSGEVDPQEIYDSLSYTTNSELIAETANSDDVFISVDGKSLSYKRSLNHDIDRLLS